MHYHAKTSAACGGEKPEVFHAGYLWRCVYMIMTDKNVSEDLSTYTMNLTIYPYSNVQRNYPLCAQKCIA